MWGFRFSVYSMLENGGMDLGVASENAALVGHAPCKQLTNKQHFRSTASNMSRHRLAVPLGALLWPCNLSAVPNG